MPPPRGDSRRPDGCVRARSPPPAPRRDVPTWTSRDDHRLDADDGRPPDPPHAQRPTATAAETRLFARVADRSPSSDASASLDAATSPDLRDHLRDHLRDDHAVAIRDGRTDAETAACDARLAAARARVASFSTRVRAAGGGVGGVATLPDTHGDYGTLRRRGDAWTAFNKRPDRIRDALAADPNLPRCPHLVGNAPSRLPTSSSRTATLRVCRARRSARRAAFGSRRIARNVGKISRRSGSPPPSCAPTAATRSRAGRRARIPC